MNLPISPGTIPGGFCPATWQDVLNEFAANMSVTLNLSNGVSVVISVNKPSDTSVVWKRIDSLGRYQGDYIFGQGAWLRLHPIQPGATVWYFQALPDFTSYDGGDGLSAGIQSGPMWQQAKDVNNNVISAKFPVAAGTLPSGTVLSNGTVGGEENHVLIADEGTPHQHFVCSPDTLTQGVTLVDSSSYIPNTNNPPDGGSAWYNFYGGIQVPPTLAPTAVSFGIVSTDTDAISFVGYTDKYKAKAHNTMPPYVTGYLLQRTSRLYYTVN